MTKKQRWVWTLKIDERNRITIPKALLELLGINSGDTIAFVKEGEGPILVGRTKVEVEIPFTTTKV